MSEFHAAPAKNLKRCALHSGHNKDMKITAFEIRTALVPLPQPHRTASGMVAASPLVLLTVESDAGLQPIAIAT